MWAVVESQVHPFLPGFNTPNKLTVKRDVVPRDEFEAIKAVAVKARAEQEKLESRVARLEARGAAKPAARGKSKAATKARAKPATKSRTKARAKPKKRARKTKSA